MTRRYVRNFRVGLLVWVLLSRVALFASIQIPLERRVRAGILLLVLGSCPYLLTGVLAGRIRNVVSLIALTVLVVVFDALASAGALLPGSSTDAVALVTEPIFVTGFLLVVMMLSGRADPGDRRS